MEAACIYYKYVYILHEYECMMYGVKLLSKTEKLAFFLIAKGQERE